MRCYYDSTLTGADTFHYVLNAQGDVVQLNYQGGTVYAEYSYDAWGNVTSIKGNSNSGSLYYAERNPLRYRGYYYDTETGFYYLQSRYYDPAVKRFLNADSYAATGQGFLGYNMFAYCGNNPVNGMDASGTRFVNTMMTDNGGGFVPPPQPIRIYDCDETRVEYQKVRNSVEQTARGILISVSVEKVGSRYTVGKDAKRNDQTMDNINNALLGTGAGFCAGYAVGKFTAIGAKIGASAGPGAAIAAGLLGGLLGYIASQIYTDYKNANSVRLDPGSYQIYKATVCSFSGYSSTACGKQYIWSYVDVYYSIGYGENSSQYNDILLVSPSPRYSYTFGLNFD